MLQAYFMQFVYDMFQKVRQWFPQSYNRAIGGASRKAWARYDERKYHKNGNGRL